MVSRPAAADAYERQRYENLLLALVEQAAGVEEAQSYPIGLIFDPSSACGLRCPMCPVSYEVEVRSKAVLRWDIFDHIIDELGPHLFFVDFFNWGEPLLNKQLPQMLAKLKRWDIEVRISSSLSVQVPDAVLESFVEHGLDCLTVSIDGFSQQSYEKYRVRGDLKLALANMERLAAIKRRRRASRPVIDWQYLVFSFNEHEIEQARAFAEKIGVDFRTAAPYVNIDKYPDWISTRDEYVKDGYRATLKARADAAAATSAAAPAWVAAAATTSPPPAAQAAVAPPAPVPVPLVLERAPADAPVERMIKLAGAPPKRCDWHYLISVVNANGSVSPCCATQEEMHDFGSAADKPFKQVWNNINYRHARRFFSTSGYSKLADPKGLLCYECIVPDDQARCDEYVERYLREAPPDILERARQVLPPYWSSRLPEPPLLAKVKGQAALKPHPTKERDTLFALELPADGVGSVIDLTTGDWDPFFVEGFHPREGAGYRWLGSVGRVMLRVPHGCSEFLLEGQVPRETATDGQLAMSVHVNGQALAELRFENPGAFVKRVPIANEAVRVVAGQFVVVELKPSRTFVPAALMPTSSDSRCLSIAVKRLGFAAAG
ncbi:MAG: radical SAM protein [Planctomycetota bacterium]